MFSRPAEEKKMAAKPLCQWETACSHLALRRGRLAAVGTWPGYTLSRGGNLVRCEEMDWGQYMPDQNPQSSTSEQHPIANCQIIPVPVVIRLRVLSNITCWYMVTVRKMAISCTSITLWYWVHQQRSPGLAYGARGPTGCSFKFIKACINTLFPWPTGFTFSSLICCLQVIGKMDPPFKAVYVLLPIPAHHDL